MTDPIRGKVARVLNSREIVINVGSENEVVVGMRFDVIDPRGEEIRDPDTNEVLGSIDRTKVRVRITKVKGKLSLASTQGQRVNVGGSVGVGEFSRLLMPPRWITQYETLRMKDKNWDDLDEKDSYVKTGDPVVQVIEEVATEQENADS